MRPATLVLLCAGLGACGASQAPAAALPAAPARDPATEELKAGLDAIMADEVPHPFAGVVLIAVGRKVVYARAHGFADREMHTPMAVGSQFRIGSVSKQMTAALVLFEVDAQRLKLDVPINKYLPELTEPWAREVTVTHLLNHTSGIEALGTPLAHRPGERFTYANANFDLLGRIVEKTSGSPFATLAQSMFKLCAMTHTEAPPSGTIASLHQSRPALATGYEENDGTVGPARAAHDAGSNPSGGILSTAEDLHRWNLCLHQRSLLAPPSYKAMTTALTAAARTHRWGPLGYGFGIQVSNQDGILELSHNGHVSGYISTLIHYPKKEIDVVVLENTSWQTDDMIRAFTTHDRVRALVRAWMARR